MGRPRSQCPEELLGTMQVVTREIDNHIGLEVSDPLSECAVLFFRNPIQALIRNRTPRGVLPVRLPDIAADTGHRKSRLEEHGGEIAADMPRPSDHNNSHLALLFLSRLRTHISTRMRCGHPILSQS
jgi:hypothetical protein